MRWQDILAGEFVPGANMVRAFALLGFCTLVVAPAAATVINGEVLRQNGNGKFTLLDTSVPFSVGHDNFNTDNLYAFDEDQNILLSEPIRVDIGGDRGMIAQGKIVASHYVFFDSYSGIHEGYVDFDAPILGIAALQETLAATDFLANNSVNYISTELRGLEPGDYVWVDPNDPFRLWVFWAGSSPGDYIRVFTEKSLGAMM
jgi:hypothetical protein